MKKVVLIPDSFKGTLSSAQICDIMEQNVKKHFPECEVVKIPVADGGEGSVNCFLTAAGGEKRKVIVKNPYMEDMEAFYGILPDKTAVIEMAACAGLPLVENRPNPEMTTTYGVGQLMLDAVEHGCKKIVVGLGGSCTNDAGAGAAAAVGVEFFDKDGEKLIPTGGTLGKVAKISMENMDERIKSAQIITMCDIDNPLFGSEGAAYIFGPQKGADPACVEFLDQGLRHLAQIMREITGGDQENSPGAGAAGGLGYGMKAFLGARLQMGIETVLDTVHFDEKLAGTAMVFSGEGRIDSQSVRGKVISGIAKRTKAAGVPLVAVVGDIGDDMEEAYQQGVSAVFSINRLAIPYEKSKLRAPEDLRLTMENIMRFIHAIQ